MNQNYFKRSKNLDNPLGCREYAKTVNSEDFPKTLREMKVIDFKHNFIIVTVT